MSRRIGACVAMLAAAALVSCTPTIRSTAPTPTPAAKARSASAAPQTPVPVNVHAERSRNRYVTIVERKGARSVYSLRAASSTLTSVNGAYDAAFVQPHIIFYDRAGKTLVADAPKALVVERQKRVTMTGGVHARAQDGTTLECRTLVYTTSTERVHGEGGVVMTSPRGAQLRGDTIDGDVRLDDVIVRGAGR